VNLLALVDKTAMQLKRLKAAIHAGRAKVDPRGWADDGSLTLEGNEGESMTTLGNRCRKPLNVAICVPSKVSNEPLSCAGLRFSMVAVAAGSSVQVEHAVGEHLGVYGCLAPYIPVIDSYIGSNESVNGWCAKLR
jgi:hypothetical protein